MKDRLLLFMNRENISATMLADEIGVQRSSISHIISGRNNPSYDFIHKMITRYNHISAEWLLTGRGDMYKVEETIDDESTRDEIDMLQEENNEKVISTVGHQNDSDLINQTNKSENLSNKTNVTNVNKIEKIVYFYKNGTFKEYNPSE